MFLGSYIDGLSSDAFYTSLSSRLVNDHNLSKPGKSTLTSHMVYMWCSASKSPWYQDALRSRLSAQHVELQKLLSISITYSSGIVEKGQVRDGLTSTFIGVESLLDIEGQNFCPNPSTNSSRTTHQIIDGNNRVGGYVQAIFRYCCCQSSQRSTRASLMALAWVVEPQLVPHYPLLGSKICFWKWIVLPYTQGSAVDIDRHKASCLIIANHFLQFHANGTVQYHDNLKIGLLVSA